MVSVMKNRPQQSLLLLLLVLALSPSSEGRKSINVLPAKATKTVKPFHIKDSSLSLLSPLQVPRGGSGAEDVVSSASSATKSAASGGENAMMVQIVVDALGDLKKYMSGGKTDALILLLLTALNTPICNNLLKLSPILGYLVLGVILGPNGLSLISDVHKTEHIADIGIVLFLFEMGVHLSFSTLMEMKTGVFGLGGLQFLGTAAVIVAFLKFFTSVSTEASIVLAGGLALSSSAFVLQLLKDKGELNSEFGKTSFGVLLLQDLAVVPLLVITPLLAPTSGDSSVSKAIISALVKAAMAVAGIALVGSTALAPLMELVMQSKSQEALIGFLLSVTMGFSFLTEGFGLSNTLGAFLAGVLLSEENSKRDHIIEKEISPFRGILVGLFFFTVGFEIDLQLIMSKAPLVASVVFGIIGSKALVVTALCRAFGKPLSIAQRAGLILSQGGEFAFVAFRMARSFGILSPELTKLMLTSVSLTMALTPFLEQLGRSFSEKIEGPPEAPPSKKLAEKKKRK